MEKITFDFKNRTALVTGGAQGFGLDIAKRFLKSGAKVIIWDIDPDMLKKATNEINSPNLSSNIVDVSNYKDVDFRTFAHDLGNTGCWSLQRSSMVGDSRHHTGSR